MRPAYVPARLRTLATGVKRWESPSLEKMDEAQEQGFSLSDYLLGSSGCTTHLDRIAVQFNGARAENAFLVLQLHGVSVLGSIPCA